MALGQRVSVAMGDFTDVNRRVQNRSPEIRAPGVKGIKTGSNGGPARRKKHEKKIRPQGDGLRTNSPFIGREKFVGGRLGFLPDLRKGEGMHGVFAQTVSTLREDWGVAKRGGGGGGYG